MEVGRIKGMALSVPFSFHQTKSMLQSSAWLLRHLRQYWLNIGLSVLDVPGECNSLFVMAMGEANLPGTIPRFFEQIS
jgi:hypothetical protein